MHYKFKKFNWETEPGVWLVCFSANSFGEAVAKFKEYHPEALLCEWVGDEST